MLRLILWDVDGTLIHTQGIGSEVFDRAFEQVLGLAPSARISERVRLSGKTDPQIAREYLELMGITDPDAHLPLVLKILEAELATAAATLAANGGAFGGVAEILARLAGTDGVYQTLLTGNLAANALVKVAAFGLDQWLDLEIGAYGSDHADRCALVPIARERALPPPGRRRGTRGHLGGRRHRARPRVRPGRGCSLPAGGHREHAVGGAGGPRAGRGHGRPDRCRCGVRPVDGGGVVRHPTKGPGRGGSPARAGLGGRRRRGPSGAAGGRRRPRGGGDRSRANPRHR